VRQPVEFVVTVTGKSIDLDGFEQSHLIIEAQRLDRDTAEFGKVSDPDRLKASKVLYTLQ
jgi:hypothetical protein